MKKTSKAIITTLCSLSLLAISAPALAATGNGTASLHISPASGSYAKNSTIKLTVTETSSVPIGGVEADFSYPTAQLQCLGINTSTSAFATTYQNICSAGTISIARGVQGATVSGSHTVAIVSFKVLGGSGNVGITVVDSSEIDDASVNNACDTSCMGGNVIASYTFTTPPPAQPKTPTATHAVATTPTTATSTVTPSTTKSTAKKTTTSPQANVLGATNTNPSKDMTLAQTGRSKPAVLWDGIGTLALIILVLLFHLLSRYKSRRPASVKTESKKAVSGATRKTATSKPTAQRTVKK